MDNASANVWFSLVIQCLILWAAAAIALGVAGARGSLKPSVLTLAPARHVVLGRFDLLALVCLWIVGMSVAVAVCGPPVPGTLAIALRTLASEFIGYGFPLSYLFYVLYRQKKGISRFGFGGVGWPQLRTAILALLLALPLVMAVSSTTSLLGKFLGSPEPKTGHVLLTLVGDDQARLGLIVLSLAVVLVAPFAEETLFRGVIQTFLNGVLGRRRRWLVLVLSGLIFASVHTGSVPWQVMPALFVLGVILGWLYETTGRLGPGMLVHGLFNASNLLLAALTIR